MMSSVADLDAMHGKGTRKGTPPVVVSKKIAQLLKIAEKHQENFGAFSVGIIGSTAFYGEDSHALTAAISSNLAGIHGLVLVTGGMKGVQDVAGSSWQETRGEGLFHLAPVGYHDPLPHGHILESGDNLAERRIVFAATCPVYIVVEGGPGTTDEGERALANGATLIPIVRTGGAAGGMFHFPACTKPECVADGDWAVLSDKAPSPMVVGAAVARMVKACLAARGVR
jgi:hypothetical protein